MSLRVVISTVISTQGYSLDLHLAMKNSTLSRSRQLELNVERQR